MPGKNSFTLKDFINIAVLVVGMLISYFSNKSAVDVKVAVLETKVDAVKESVDKLGNRIDALGRNSVPLPSTNQTAGRQQ